MSNAIQKIIKDYEEATPHKTMRIIKKSEAMKILKKTPGAYTFNWCTGKYVWKGEKEHVGGEVYNVTLDVIAIYVQRQVDEDGPYARVKCVMDPKIKWRTK
jgi:hypothetical protein